MKTEVKMKTTIKSQVVYTNPAKCRDCYRCVRVCPVNAIKIKDGQANVIIEKCIACGICVNECPQGAKQYRSDVEKVTNYLNQNIEVAISLAPSFVSIYDEWEQKRIPSALRELGFSIIEETAIGAYYVAQESLKKIKENPNKSHISSSCSAVVEYIEKYVPERISNILEVNSPMMAHAKMLKQKWGREVKVVFIGPCTAKKLEANRSENRPFIDAVLSFEEFDQLLKLNHINLGECEESSFDRDPIENARLFPLEGGLLKTANLSTDMLSQDIIAVSGFKEIKELLENMNSSSERMVIEPLFCKSGCINGPVIIKNKNIYERRRNVIEFGTKKPNKSTSEEIPDIDTHFKYQSIESVKEFKEEDIQKIFEISGKSNPENQLNCGACGYENCRENAKAVIEGIAEAEMCMPYMRRLAEQKNDTIVNTAPNGIVILDEKLQIISINPSFKKMFSCSDAIAGKPISYLIDQDPFEKLIAKPEEVIKKVVRYNSYNLVCHQIHYALPEEKHFVGVFVDITNVHLNEFKLNKIKQETVVQAQELMEHQISMAQQIAKFLGENSAKGEMLMKKLIDVIEEDN